MLSQAMVEHLNEQINLEFFSSNLYLQMSAWCEDKGFDGAAEFLRAHAVEEMQHMQRLFTYVSETVHCQSLVRSLRHATILLHWVKCFVRRTNMNRRSRNRLINWLMWRSPPKTTQHLTSFSGTWLNSTKKRSCLKGF